MLSVEELAGGELVPEMRNQPGQAPNALAANARPHHPHEHHLTPPPPQP